MFKALYRKYREIRKHSTLNRSQAIKLVANYMRPGNISSICVDGSTYYFKKDPATLSHAHHAIERIQRNIDALPENLSLALCIDVGANNGWFSACLASKHKSVFCHLIEPNPALNITIDKNLKHYENRFSKHNLAISRNTGFSNFYVAVDNSQHSSLIKQAITLFSDTQPVEETRVAMESLDSFCQRLQISRIDLLKVDIQGAEYDLVQGGRNAIHNAKMAIFEMTFIDKNFLDCFSYLKEEFGDYKVLDPVAYGADILFFRS